MKKLWIVLIACTLNGCVLSDVNIHRTQPTALDFGDSISLGMSGPARLALDGKVDYRHDPWVQGNIHAENDPWFYGNVMLKGVNSGPSIGLLQQMQQNLKPGDFYTVLLFNSGVHDAQAGVYLSTQSSVSLDKYRSNLEAIAAIAEKHATYVIWVDTTPISAGALDAIPAGIQVSYNQVAHQVAREHGFYIVNTDNVGQLPGNVHFTFEGYQHLGDRVAHCVLLVLQGGEGDYCHR